MNLQPLSAEQSDELRAASAAYAAMWAEINVPFPCDFSGSKTDIEVLDFVDYEAGEHPQGARGAALLWGNVLAKTGVVAWCTDGSDLFLRANAEHYPRCLIWPYARVLEMYESQSPQHGKYEWLLQETVARVLMQGFSEAEQDVLIALTSPSPYEGYVHWGRLAIDRIYMPKLPKRCDYCGRSG